MYMKREARGKEKKIILIYPIDHKPINFDNIVSYGAW